MPSEIEPEVDNEEFFEQLPRHLLSYIKAQKIKEAYTLLEENLDINYSDEVGCTALHYAAVGGHTDMVVKLIEKGANTKQADVNGETPVHKATRKGWRDVVIAMVAYGADINILNNNGQSALELSVLNKDVHMLKMLCKLGAEASMQDWAWTMENSFGKKDLAMMELLLEQSNKYSGYKYGGISFEVVHIKEHSEIAVPSLGITVQTSELPESYYLFCCEMQHQYSDIKDRIQDAENLFSEIYEFAALDGKSRTLKLQIKIPGIPVCNEKLSVFGVVGQVHKGTEFLQTTSDDTDDDSVYNAFTTVDVAVTQGRYGVAQLAVIVTDKPESFVVNKAAICLKPTTEPQAEIEIPKDTFGSKGELQISMAPTKVLNSEDDDIKEPILITNVMDISMCDGKQPQNTIKIKMPVHTPTDSDIVVYACHKEYPEDVDDWEISEVDRDRGGKFVVFDVSKFSSFVVGSKNFEERAKMRAIQAIEKKRAVELFGMIKGEIGENFTIIFECAMKKNGKKRRKQWRKKGFLPLPDEYHGCIVPVYQEFRVKISENLLGQGFCEKGRAIIFNPNIKRQYVTFDIPRANDKVSGTMSVEMCIKRDVNMTQNYVPFVEKKPGLFCSLCRKGTENNPEELNQTPVQKYDYEVVKVFRVSNELPELAVQDKKFALVDPTDPECPINLIVLRWSSLEKLADRLTEDECFRLGIQLNISPTTLNELKEEQTFKMKMFEEWRPKRPYHFLVEILEIALERIDKNVEAEMVQTAFETEMEFGMTGNEETENDSLSD